MGNKVNTILLKHEWSNMQAFLRHCKLFLFCLIFLNPFAPEPPVTARADPCALYCLWCHQFLWSRTTLSANLWREKRSFKPYQNEHNSVKDSGEKGKKPCNVKISMKSCSSTHLPFLSFNPKILKAFLKTFPTKMKPTKCPGEKKKETRKEKKEGRRESEK